MSFTEPNLVTRTGGDEFAVLVECVVDPRAVESLARHIQEAFALPFRVRGRTVALSASIGVAVTTPASSRPADLLRAASVALSWAKAQGGGRVAVFDPDRDAGESARAALLAGMPDGVERGEFLLHYQPLVRLHDGRVRGAEAHERTRRARLSTARGSTTHSTSTANSSPPVRVTRFGAATWCSRVATSTSSRSPRSWPNVSFTEPNPSRSSEHSPR